MYKKEESVSILPLNRKSPNPQLLVILSHNTPQNQKQHLWNVPEEKWNPCGIPIIYDPAMREETCGRIENEWVEREGEWIVDR